MNSVKNHADAVIFYTAICDGAPQIAMMADKKLPLQFLVAPSRKALRNEDYMEKIPNEAMTHSGRFHADDVFSAALLKILNPQINIVRGDRVPEHYEGVVFDLGDGVFDHHCPQIKLRDNGVPYAAFGLLWKEYGAGLVGEKEAERFDESFIQPLDFQDNHGGNDLLCRAITQSNPKWDEEADAEECFFKAVEMAKFILENEIKSMRSTEHAEQTVRQCLSRQKDGIVVLPTGMPWKALLVPENVFYVVYPSDRGGYNAQAVPKALDTQECKKPFPKEWRGRRNAELSRILGMADVNFCHLGGYLLNADSEESAIGSCRLSLQQEAD